MADDHLYELQHRLHEFATERDWEQYHTPKNLAMALAAEVGELLDIFQWLTPQESSAITYDSDSMDAVRDELADVMIYLVRLADVLSVDLIDVARAKIDANELRFRPSN
jgi:dCTP diphosphatase